MISLFYQSSVLSDCRTKAPCSNDLHLKTCQNEGGLTVIFSGFRRHAQRRVTARRLLKSDPRVTTYADALFQHGCVSIGEQKMADGESPLNYCGDFSNFQTSHVEAAGAPKQRTGAMTCGKGGRRHLPITAATDHTARRGQSRPRRTLYLPVSRTAVSVR